MNELERHEAAAVSGRSAAPPKGLGEAAETARAAIGDATANAKTALRNATDVVSGTYDDASTSARQTYLAARTKVSDMRRHAPGSPEEARKAVVDFADANPVMVAVIGVAAGMIAGALLPGTVRENQAFGRYADDVKDQGLRYARDLAEQGRHYVEESFEAAKQEATRSPGPRDS